MKYTRSRKIGVTCALIFFAWVVYRIIVFEPYGTAEIENCSDRVLYAQILREKGIPIVMISSTKFELKGSAARRSDEVKAAYEARQLQRVLTLEAIRPCP